MNEQEFFNQLAEKLEELFPKGECKERSQALVLNAYANILFKQAIMEERPILKQELNPNVCGIVIQHTIMGSISCANPKGECFLHDVPPTKLEEGQTAKL